MRSMKTRSMILSSRKLKLCGCRRLKLTVKGGGIVLCACVSLRKKYFEVGTRIMTRLRSCWGGRKRAINLTPRCSHWLKAKPRILSLRPLRYLRLSLSTLKDISNLNDSETPVKECSFNPFIDHNILKYT